MAIQMITATNVKLLRVHDLRPIDWNSGKRLAIPANECNVCDRCGKLHVKVDIDFYDAGHICAVSPGIKSGKSREKGQVSSSKWLVFVPENTAHGSKPS